MKFKLIKSKEPQDYQERIVSRFAWFPVSVTFKSYDILVWLEYYKSYEYYSHDLRTWLNYKNEFYD